VCVLNLQLKKKALKTPRLGTGTLCNEKRHSRGLWMLLPAILTMAPVVRGFIIPVGLQQFIYRLSLKELMEVPECSDRKWSTDLSWPAIPSLCYMETSVCIAWAKEIVSFSLFSDYCYANRLSFCQLQLVRAEQVKFSF